MQNEVKHTWHFNQSPKEVWEYLTKSELLEQWLMPNDFKPVVGHKFRFTMKDMQHYCEVLEVKPFTKLSYSWKKDNMPVDSKVTWTLTPKGSGTELQIVHDGFTVLKDVTDHNNGWSFLGNQFVELLNKVTK
jgi:uncharacterized protein YndB with AHSA1/START domain